MHVAFASLWMMASLAAPAETKFAQVAPAYREADAMARSTDEDCAVVLIQGLRVHPFSGKNVTRAKWQSWQESDSALVQALAKDSDVFALAYSQNVAVEEVAEAAEILDGIHRLKQLGYSQVVLVGHSAGGLIARQFIEDRPGTGVTKVIQVCTPNGGSCWGEASLGVRKRQEVFLISLSREGRECCLGKRSEKKIPADVEFVCLVGQLEFQVDLNMSLELWKGRAINVSAKKDLRGDGIVSSSRQWTPDLQSQGIPAVAIPVCHVWAMRSVPVIEKICETVREKQLRIPAGEVAMLRQQLLGQGK